MNKNQVLDQANKMTIEEAQQISVQYQDGEVFQVTKTTNGTGITESMADITAGWIGLSLSDQDSLRDDFNTPDVQSMDGRHKCP